MKNLLIIISICLTGLFATMHLSLTNLNYDSDGGTLDVFLENSEEIGGFQFTIDEVTITGADGAPAGFTFTTSSSTVIGISFSAGIIPAGEGVLTTVAFVCESGEGGEVIVEDCNSFIEQICLINLGEQIERFSRSSPKALTSSEERSYPW